MAINIDKRKSTTVALIDKPELARQIKVSVPLVNKWVQERKIPFLKIGTLVRFNLEEVLSYLEATSKKEAEH